MSTTSILKQIDACGDALRDRDYDELCRQASILTLLQLDFPDMDNNPLLLWSITAGAMWWSQDEEEQERRRNDSLALFGIIRAEIAELEAESR